MKTDQYTKDFTIFYQKIKKEQAKYKSIVDKKYSDFIKIWADKNSPYKIGDVLEVVDNKRMKFRRMVIYTLGVQILFKDIPVLSAYGWWLDKDNNPIKWNGSGYPLLNCTTNYKMILSDNQIANPVKEEIPDENIEIEDTGGVDNYPPGYDNI